MAQAPSSVRVASRYARLLAPVRNWRATWRVLERKMVATQASLRALSGIDDGLLDEAGILNPPFSNLENEISNLRLIFDAAVPRVDAQEMHAAAWLKDDLERAIGKWDSLARGLQGVERQLRDAGDLTEYYDPKEVAAVQGLPSLLADHRLLLQETFDRMVAATATIFAPVPETMKPKATETMWHASVNARDLVSSGFLREPPQDSLGLGGSQADAGGNPSTSFTYELYLAKEIARSFKEISLIAKGSVTGLQVLDWIRRLGKAKAEKTVEFAREVHGVGRDEYKGRLKFEGGEWVATRVDRHRAGGLDRVPLSEVFTDKGKVINLYLSYIKHAPGRLDPFYVRGGLGLARQFAGVNPNNIGIVQATIDMSHPGLKRVSQEREYRVPVDAIMSVDKLIR